MKIEGSCHCGHISYEAEIDPARVSICHCTDCQTLTGTAYRVSIGAQREDVRLTGGEPKVYVKTADSGRKRRQYFCPECGAPVFTSTDDDASERLGIRWGSVKQRAALAPTHRSWVRSSQTWMGRINELPGTAQD